jgi:predicted HTH domain antitoxin
LDKEEKMTHLQLDLPEGFELAVNLTTAELESQVRLMAALKMFELGKLSSGKAAELAGVSRIEFLELCGRYQVSVIQYDEDDLTRELEVLNSWNQ